MWMCLLAVALADPMVADAARTWEVGDTGFAAGTGINVRAQADTRAEVVGSLPLGAPVTVTEAGGPELTLGERTARWVRVDSGSGKGWVWSGALTGARVQGDLDGDGADEVGVLAWKTDDHLAVRLARGESGVELDLGEYGDIEGTLLEAHLTFAGPGQVGVPLLKVYVPGREMCGSGTWTTYVSWDGKSLHKAISASTWADAPYYDSTTLTWDPDEKRVQTSRLVGGDEEEKSITQWHAWDGSTFAAQGMAVVTTKRIDP